MAGPTDEAARRVQDIMSKLDRSVDGFRGVEVRHQGDRLCMTFRWFHDPNIYEFCSVARGGPWAWGAMDAFDGIDLTEELETGYLLRAVKARRGQVLRIDLGARAPRDWADNNFYLSELLEYVGHLERVGLDTAPGLAARRAGTLLGWTDAAVNSRTGGPVVAQIVTVRDTAEEAHIAHLELTDQARPIVGCELVFVAIHNAARLGIHRLYSPRADVYVEPFSFVAADDRPAMVVYDITTRDLNWPDNLSPSAPS